MEYTNKDVDELANKLRNEKEQYMKRRNQIILDFINFNKEDTYYFYCCRGSGYYLKYTGEIDREHLIFDIYTKGGKPKNKQFSLHWCYINYLKKV